eukprot:gnl/MRDRNA2_/MRDRNA2_213004_c0_seq1.p1 gnl/MRDRNA2_/MRDRNA2_213004_c0~~gnl/MRDRNA2_/MRDRNA2_213004_c0_seq1.p1  ORF type:complete len:115 (-),score=9.52 gnl/MRDRNA2_/MRDRNA2_213004_c0_seq1:35-379(-)
MLTLGGTPYMNYGGTVQPMAYMGNYGGTPQPMLPYMGYYINTAPPSGFGSTAPPMGRLSADAGTSAKALWQLRIGNVATVVVVVPLLLSLTSLKKLRKFFRPDGQPLPHPLMHL